MKFLSMLNEGDPGNGGSNLIMFLVMGGLIGLIIVMMFVQRRRQRQVMDTQATMLDRLRMGMRIKTVSGVIGRIKEIREEVSGLKTVLIETGNDKYNSFLQVDINAIMEIVGEPGMIVEPAVEVGVTPEPQETKEEEATEDFNAEDFVKKSNATRKDATARKPKTKP